MKNVNFGNGNFSAWNERMAERYSPHEFHTKSILPIRWIERARVRMIVRLLNPQPRDRILEIGCGAGNLIEYFECGKLFGLDLAKSLLKQAQSKAYKTDCHLLRCYGETTPFRNSTFDKIYCSEVLEHVPDPSRICQEAHRILKEGGLFVASVPNEKTIDFFKSLSHKLSLGYTFTSDEWHLHNFDLRQLTQALGTFFTMERVQYVPSRWFPTRIVARCRRID